MADEVEDATGDVCVWRTEGPSGEPITVTTLEAQAVKAWAEAMVSQVHAWSGPGVNKCCIDFFVGFLAGAMKDTDENVALAIACGRRIQIEYGERPMMATYMAPEEAAEKAASNPRKPRYRRW